jgi:hypothetical protein
MGSDIARLSYNPHHEYRAAVMQQGRVTLEADFNEQQQIAGRELLADTLDIVGPAGTPDDGYRVLEQAQAVAHDFQVGAGTMYVGGVQLALDKPVLYSN